MSLTLCFPPENGGAVLATTANTVVTFTTKKRALHGQVARISLLFDTLEEVQTRVTRTKDSLTLPNTLVGVHYEDGVVVDDAGQAQFVVRPNVLSSQYSNRLFSFRVIVEGDMEAHDSVSFKLVTKPSRKRHRRESSSSRDSSSSTVSECDTSDWVEVEFKRQVLEALSAVQASQRLLCAQMESLKTLIENGVPDFAEFLGDLDGEGEFDISELSSTLDHTTDDTGAGG